MLDLKIFNDEDIQGIYSSEIDEEGAFRLGQAYAAVVKPTKPVAVGYDVRVHSPTLAKQAISGLNSAGVSTIDIGLVATEMLYFAVGKLSLGGGIQVTGSPNPAEYHGLKLVRENVVPLSGETGIFEVRDFALSDGQVTAKKKGKNTAKKILDPFCRLMLGMVDSGKIRPLTLVYNPNFGYSGKILERLVALGKLPLKLIPLNAEPDGTFPKGRPDPFVPENRTEFIELVKTSGADLGVTWDAGGDRVFFCADGGNFVEPYYLNTLLIKYSLTKNSGGKVIYDPRYTWALVDAITENGGEAVLERVGHTLIKERMRKEEAVFAGESSGHTYYRDFWHCDTGILPLLQILDLISTEGKKFSEMIAPAQTKYFISGEINSETDNKEDIIDLIVKRYYDSNISNLDGVTVEYAGQWRANIRSSNTEPLLRLNVEATSRELMEQKRDELLRLIHEKA